ncbi:hypothetical protein [Sphingomonas sp.]|jgi:hypothetical protein|uniref:hypothetical protein n=1 Tax=Sphingomonas sp. TaxID=28214 RepID=UPI002EDA525E
MTRVRLAIASGAALLLIIVAALIYRTGSGAGAAKVEARVERDHGTRVAEARTDERAAAVSAVAIGATTARRSAAFDDYVLTSIKEMRDALAAVPPAPAGAPLPAAPVDSLRDQLNAGIARANRAAEPAGAPR